LATFVTPYLSNAQTSEKVRTLPAQIVSEAGCPIAMVSTRAELDLDPFNAPIDARVYITYRNVADKPIEAAKFRIRLVDDTGNELQTFQAPEQGLTPPGADHAAKWKREQIDPHATQLQVRALQIRFADGSTWESVKMKELAQPSGPNPQAGAQPPPTDNQSNH